MTAGVIDGVTEPGPNPDRRADRPLPGGRTDTDRHPPLVRVSHWVNVAAVVILIMSGLNILLAHLHLDWGKDTNCGNHWVDIPPIPNWLLIPDHRNLAEARHWHFFFAWVFVINGLIYLAFIAISGRLKRMIAPTRADLADIPHSVVEHAQLKFPKGEEARRYNVLQKLTYLLVLLVLLPMMLATGLAMSPLGNRLKSSIVRGISAASTSNSDSLTCTGWDSTGIAATSSSQENTRRIFIEISKGWWVRRQTPNCETA